jgi:hypothetical protein
MTEQLTRRRCAVLRRYGEPANIHGSMCRTFEHKVVLLDEGQSEDFDPDYASRRWLHPHLTDGFHLMEFTDLVPQ